MAKTRIYEIAKELNIDSKEIMEQLDKMQVSYKNHMSTVEPEIAEKLLRGKNSEEQSIVKNDQKNGAKDTKVMQNEQGKNEEKQLETEKKSMPQREGQRPPRDGERPQRDGQRPQRDGERPQRDGQRPPRDGERPQRDGQRPPRDGERPQRDGQRPQRDGHRPQRDGQRPPRDGHRPQRDGERPQRDGQRPQRDNDWGKDSVSDMSSILNVHADLLHSDAEEVKQAMENLQIAQANEAQWVKGTQNGSKAGRTEGKKKDYNDNEDEDFGSKNRNKKKNDFNRDTNRTGGKNKKNKKQQVQEVPKEFAEVKHHVIIDETISVQDLAHQLGKKSAEVIMKLMGMGVMATINQELDVDTATIIAEEFGATVEVKITKEEELLVDVPDNPEDLKSRPAVVTIMGHVDHGKTSLLDKIRSSNVTASEAGGITQHIGAYQVEIHGQKITFLDTPGHEAFTAMRARGAQVTDIAILVVAADDGVMPQTIEAIDHARAAGVPIIVAINKIDKPEANAERIMQELTSYGLVAEYFGGQDIMVPVSAKKGMGIDDLLEMILLVAEMQELKANPDRNAKGKVVESKLDKGRGPVATLLVQNGTLHVGDFLIVGTTQGRIRAMFDYKGKAIKVAGPSTPVEILGLSEVPEAGDDFVAVDNEKLAKQVAEKRQKDKHMQEISRNMKVSLEDIFAQIKEGEVKDLNIVLKADVQGSIEAIRQSLEKISTDEVHVNIIRTAVGGIREGDVMLAAASNAIIIGFNVRPDSNAKKLAEKENVEVKTYRIIYDAIEDVKAALSGMLAPEIKEVELGQAEIRTTFKVPKVGTVAGCYVTEGKITRHAKIRVVRDGVVIHDGELASLKRFKDDAKEVAAGFECGIGLE